MTEATFPFRVDEALKAEFTQAAKSRDRTAVQLLRDYMRDFVRQQRAAADHDAWFRREVQAGIDAAQAGGRGLCRGGRGRSRHLARPDAAQPRRS